MRRAQHGKTALIEAANYGRADCARLLLDTGADTNATDNVRANAVCGWGVCVVGVMLMMGCGVWKHVICISFCFSCLVFFLRCGFLLILCAEFAVPRRKSA